MALTLISQDAGMMELIRSRLANDERPLKRTLKAFYKLAEPSEEDVTDQVERCRAEFLMELRGLARTLETTKGARIVGMTERELDGLRAEKRKVEEQTEEQSKKIRLLEGELEQARQERREKLEYEEVGREVRRFGDRLQSAERLAGLSKEIQGLLEEQESYSQRWASRQTQFDLVVKNLLSLQESIREEKEDADRKKALGDDRPDEDDAASDSGAGIGADTSLRDPTSRAVSGSPRPGLASLDPSAPSFRPSSSITRPGTPAAGASSPLARARPMSGDREMDEMILKGMAGSEGGGTPAAVAPEEDTAMEDGEERE